MAKKAVELPAVMVISAHNGNFCPPFDEPGVAPDGALVEGLGAPVALWEYIPETKAASVTSPRVLDLTSYFILSLA